MISTDDGANDIEGTDRTDFGSVRCICNHDSLSCLGESLCEDTREGDSIQSSRRLKAARYGKRYRFSGRNSPTDSHLPRIGSSGSTSKQKSKSKSKELSYSVM